MIHVIEVICGDDLDHVRYATDLPGPALPQPSSSVDVLRFHLVVRYSTLVLAEEASVHIVTAAIDHESFEELRERIEKGWTDT